MTHQAKDDAREERITMEIIVDAYGPEEQAIGWYGTTTLNGGGLVN